MAAKVGELEQDPGANDSISRLGVDAKIGAMDRKIDLLVESNTRLAQKIDKAHAEFKEGIASDRRSRLGGIVATVLGVGAIVAAIVIFAQNTTQSWTQVSITRIESAVEALTRQIAALPQTTPPVPPEAPQPSPQGPP